MAAKKARTLADTMSELKATPEEEAFLDEVEENESNAPDLPEWVELPAGFKFPSGKVVSFLRFKAEWTDTPKKGDRVCIMWNLNGADEKNAIQRTRGDGMKLIMELSKQMVRVVDGHKSDWTGKKGPGDVDRFYDEIGAKCRQLIQGHYVKTHTLSDAERVDFLDTCIVVRTAG
jgi:hypothetical protein